MLSSIFFKTVLALLPLVGTVRAGSTCTSPQLSCHEAQQAAANSTASCCSNGALTKGGKEAGLIVQTQFWDYNPAVGLDDSTSVHGLWPDYCDGTYPSSCSSSTGIATTTGSHIADVISKNDPDLYSFMKANYVDNNGGTTSFWEHEFNKHGTCYSTLRPSCITPVNGLSAADTAILGYFQTMIKEFKNLPTYDWLTQSGITPSTSKTYTRTQIQNALENQFGAEVYIGCDGSNLNEFWYHFNVKGPLIGGEFYPVDTVASSDCPSSGIKWQPKQ